MNIFLTGGKNEHNKIDENSFSDDSFRKKSIFSETRPFLSTFWKKGIFDIENYKNTWFFASSNARLGHNMRNDGLYTHNFGHSTHNVGLGIVLSP